MTTPHTHESTAHVEGEDDQGVKQGEWRRMVIGFFLGVALAALVWFLFPSNAVETVLQSSGADPEEEYTYGAIRAVAAVTILMGVWWMTEAIPLAATALLPLVIFPLAGVGTIKRSVRLMHRRPSFSLWAASSSRWLCSAGTCTAVWR